MSKIKIDKEKLQVIFQCKTNGEMKWVLDLYSKGAQETAKEARASIGISDEPKLYLVEVEASVYDNDINLVVVADNSTEAINIVKEEKPNITFGAKNILASLLTPEKTIASGWKEYRPNGKGIVYAYSPHAGDQSLGE